MTNTTHPSEMEAGHDWYAYPLSILYMFVAVLLLLRRYSHHVSIINARDEIGCCCRILKGLETHLIALIIFMSGVIAITMTEFVGGETSITVLYASLVGCFVACLVLAYLQSVNFLDSFENSQVLFKCLSLFLSCRWHSTRKACSLITKHPVRFLLELFFYIFSLNFCIVLFFSKANVHFDDFGNLCFTSWDSVSNQNMDGGFGKLRPESELAAFAFLVYGLGFYSVRCVRASAKYI